MRVTVNCLTRDYKIIKMEVDESATVKAIAEQILTKEGIEIANQKYVFKARSVFHDEPLSSLGITEKSMLYLIDSTSKLEVAFLNRPPQFFEITSRTTVEELSTMICEDCPERVRLFYRGKCLEHDRTLSDYGISSNSKLHCLLRFR